MPTLTGFGPRRDNEICWSRLLFNNNEEKYEIWKAKFLGYKQSLGLKDTILGVNLTGEDKRNEEAYVEFVQFLYDKCLPLIMREATDNRRKALNILCSHYAGKGKPKVISLYSQLTSLKKRTLIKDYVIRIETILTALRNAKQIVNDALILKGLPRHFNPFPSI